MNFEILKLGFLEYLKDIGKISEDENYSDMDTSVSIFTYSNEFKDYVVDELNLDSSAYSMDVSELMNFEFEEKETNIGNKNEDNTTQNEAVIPENGKTAEEAPVNSNENTSNTEAESSALVANMFNELLKTEEFKNAIDKNNNGISDDELKNFFATIKGSDSNEENISLEDLVAASEQIKNGEFKTTTPETVIESMQQEKAITAKADIATGGSGGGGNNSTPYRKDTLDNTVQKEDLNSKNLEELNAIKTERAAALSTAEEEYETKKTETTQQENDLKTAEQTAYDKYQQELQKLDAEDAKKVAEKKTQIDDKEKEIKENTQELADSEIAYTKAEDTMYQLASQEANLNSILTSLNNAKNSDEEGENADIGAQIQAIQQQLEAIKVAKQEAEEAKNAAKEKIDACKEKEQTLQTELDTLNQEMSDLEAQILKDHPTIEASMKEYQDARKAYSDFKVQSNQEVISAKDNVVNALNSLDEVNTAIITKQNAQIAREYSQDGLTDLTRNAVELAYQELKLGVHEDAGDNRGTMEKYGGRPGDPWCASFVSWLYGAGQPENSSPITYTAGVSGLRDQAITAGYYSEVGTYTPVPGDIMIQKSNGASHTGIVVGADDKYIYTIEGNSSNAVRERKYEIGSSAYQSISGWIRMNEWSGGSSDIATDTYLVNNNSEDADKEKRSTL